MNEALKTRLITRLITDYKEKITFELNRNLDFAMSFHKKLSIKSHLFHFYSGFLMNEGYSSFSFNTSLKFTEIFLIIILF